MRRPESIKHRKPEVIETDRSVIHRIRCTHEENLGDLVLTDKGISFVGIKGILGESHERLHQFEFDDIRHIRTKRKQSGIFSHGVSISHHTESGENQSYFFSCEEYKAALFLSFFERQILLRETPRDLSITIQSLETIKRHADLLKVAKNPKLRSYFFAFALDKLEMEIMGLLEHRFDVDLFEVALSRPMHSLVALLHESEPKKVLKVHVFQTIIDLVSHLISRNRLDGIITDAGRYVSNKALERIPDQYDVLADFHTIFAQLNEKGILVWALDCPTCYRKIKYPKSGTTTMCQFCSETIHAKDVLRKFVDLL